MDTVINYLQIIRNSLGTLQITSSRRNLDTLLGCMQLCDRCIAELQQAMEQEMQQENANTEGEQ